MILKIMSTKNPNFLGIGSVRGGSTWLYELLNSHPDFYFPKKRKEIQYFTRFYDKGENWYRNLFPTSIDSPRYQGEYTPGYLTAQNAPERINKLNSVEKFILILRNPVDRTYSHYKWHLRVSGQNIDFETFCKNSQRLAIENGLYFKYLRRYLDYFNIDQFLILIYEEVTENPIQAIEQISAFFNVNPEFFKVPQRTNISFIPRRRKLFNLAHRVVVFLRKNDLDFIPNIFINFGIKDSFGNAGEMHLPKLSDSEKMRLYAEYRKDIESLEVLLKRSLGIWTSDFENLSKAESNV